MLASLSNNPNTNPRLCYCREHKANGNEILGARLVVDDNKDFLYQ